MKYSDYHNTKRWIPATRAKVPAISWTHPTTGDIVSKGQVTSNTPAMWLTHEQCTSIMGSAARVIYPAFVHGISGPTDSVHFNFLDFDLKGTDTEGLRLFNNIYEEFQERFTGTAIRELSLSGYTEESSSFHVVFSTIPEQRWDWENFFAEFGSQTGKLVLTIKGYPKELFHIELWSNYGKGRYRLSTGAWEEYHPTRSMTETAEAPDADTDIPELNINDFCTISAVEELLRSTQSRNYIAYSMEQDLPYRFRPGTRTEEIVSPERVEVERLLYYCYPDLALLITRSGSKQLYAAGLDGLWLGIYTAGYNSGIVRIMLDRARKRALTDMEVANLPTWYIEAMRVREFSDISVRRLRDVITLLQASESDTRLNKISERHWGDMAANPVLHVKDEEGHPLLLSLKHDGGEMTVGDLKAMHITSMQSSDTRYIDELPETPAATEMTKLVHEHYGTELMERMAYLLVGCHKTIDTVSMTTSNSGKDLLATMLQLATGAVESFESANVLKSGNRRFSKIEHAMAGNSIVFIQNYHMIDEIDKSFIDGITSQGGFQEELKGENTKWVPSRGNLVLTGSGPLPIEGHGQQGANTRFAWRYENDHAPQIPEVTARLVLGITGDPGGLQYLLAWLVDTARRIHGELAAGEYSPDTKGSDAAQAMLRETTPILHDILLDLLRFTNSEDSRISVEEIQTALLGRGVSKVASDARKLRAALNIIFSGELSRLGITLYPTTIRFSGGVKRGYRYLALKSKPKR